MSRRPPARSRRGALVGVVAAAALAAVTAPLTGCGGYQETVASMNRAIFRGQLEQAAQEVSGEIGAEGLPDEVAGVVPLLLLERATIQYARGAHRLSARDFVAADRHLEVLDLTTDVGGDIARFLFSGSSKVYVAPPFEKLMLNALNLANYLALGQLEEARVEARRLAIVQDLVRETEGEALSRTGLGSYLAGFAFERSGQPEEAVRFYEEALEARPFPSLRAPLRRLVPAVGYRPPRVSALVGDEPRAPAAAERATGELLVVVAQGRVPHKVAARIPIGLALTWAASAPSRYALSPEARAQAASLAARGLLTWINFPELVETPVRYTAAEVQVDGRPVSLDLAADTADRARRSFERLRPVLVVSAITRMVARLLAGIGVEEGIEAASKSKGLGLLLGLAVQGGLTAADTPDTRSWVSLPGAFWIGRHRLPVGSHTVTYTAFDGVPLRETREVTIRPGGYAVVTFTTLR